MAVPVRRRGAAVPRLAGLAALGIPWLMAGCDGPYSTLDPAGPVAGAVAPVWWGMFIGATLVLLAVVALWLVAMRRDPGELDQARAQRIQNRWIAGGGIALPLASITALLLFGLPAGLRMLPLPSAQEPLRIEVTGHRWWWEVHYPDHGIRLVDEIHLPAGMPVDIVLSSADVIHSFWVPRLAGKLDAIPGYRHTLRLQADLPGLYRGECAEFCGLRHAHMHFSLEAHSPADFQAWLARQNSD